VHTDISCGILRERDHWEDVGLDGRITLKLICKNSNRSVDWIDLAQDRENGMRFELGNEIRVSVQC